MSDVTDLLSLDRDVARAARALSAWRRVLAKDPEAAAEDDPFIPLRHVAGQSTYEALARLTPSLAEGPLRDALRRWVYALTQTRLGLGVEVERGREVLAESARYEGERPRLVSWREAWRGVAAARNRHEADPWLQAAADRGPVLAAVERERRERRIEVARRLGIDAPDSPLVPASIDGLTAQARTFLDGTEDVAAAVRREASPEGGVRSPADVLVAAGARDAADGWPARLTARWLEERFGAMVYGLSLDLPPLPRTLGAASYGRAAFAFGVAFRHAATPRSLPFTVGHEPWPVAAYRWGFLFAGLLTQPDFHRVSLGLTRRVSLAHARSLTKSALLDARMHAARLLLAEAPVTARQDLFEDLGLRLTGMPLPKSLGGAWPWVRDDEPARWLALLTTLPRLRGLVERFDVDWFRNPRSAPYLRASAAGPAREPETVLADEAALLARAFEESIG